jgi:hypothetical protein
MSDLDWNFQLAEQLDWHWREQLRPRLNGMTDVEYRWEPVPGAWNVRPRGTGTAPAAVGAGEFNREVLHHGAEIALLRDLYRWQFDGKGA